MPVAARFTSARDAVLAAVDRTFAETVRLSFLAGGRPDPMRPVSDIEAVLRVGGGEETNVSGGYSQSWRTQLASGRAELHINRANYSGPMPRKHDAVQALSRPGQPWFEVLRVDDRGEARLVLELGEK